MNKTNILRFNPIQIAEWMEDMLPRNVTSKDRAIVTLIKYLGISRTRAIQFLNLMRIPEDLRGRLKEMGGVTEGGLRRVVQMDSGEMRIVVGGMVGRG